MSTQEGAGAGGNPGAGAASADAGANPGGTPNPGAADAATKAGSTGGASKPTLEQMEADRNAARAERDAAKAAKREIEGKLAELTEKVNAFEKARTDAERRAAEEQGKFKELYEKERADREAAEKRAAEAASSARTRVAKTHIESTFKGLGGVDTEWLDFKASKAIERGDLKIGDDGTVAGVEVFLDGLRKAHPAQFGAAAAGGGGVVPGGTGAAPPNDPKKLLNGRRGNLGDGPVLKPDERRALNEMWPKK